MSFRVAEPHGLSNALSPFRVIEQSGREVEWVNRFLDQQCVRGVAGSTLRSYAHDLLHFLRWWAAAHNTSAITKQALTESTFLDYIRGPGQPESRACCGKHQPPCRNRRACHAA